MTQKLVSEIINIKTNNLDSYVSKYFDAHLQNKQDVLSTFLKNKYLLKIDACIWALVIALDGKYFDELIIDEYTSYDVSKDLRFIVGSDTFGKFVTNEFIVRIALSKEFRCIYQVSPFKVRNAFFFADGKMKDDVICSFKRIVETQMYSSKPIFENCNLTYIDEEINLLKSIFNTKKVHTLSPTLLFYALHDIIYPCICLEELGLTNEHLQSEINIILSDKKVRANFIKIPGLLTSTIRSIDKETFDKNFSFDEILQSIAGNSYFVGSTSTFRTLIMYVYNRFPNRMDELENAFLNHIKNNEFSVKYDSILHFTMLEQSLRKFKNKQVFIDTIIDLPIAYDLFCDFKKRNNSFKNGLSIALKRYDVEFDYIVNLVSRVIDDEDPNEIAEFQSFKNLF